MIYKTVVVDYAPKAATMAQEIQKTVTAMAREGWELVTFSVAPDLGVSHAHAPQKGRGTPLHAVAESHRADAGKAQAVTGFPPRSARQPFLP